MSMQMPAVINGRYQLLRALGSGAQGDSWLVRDLYQNEEVALKIIRHEFGPWQEAQVLTALRDRHILPVRNADFVAGTKFLVTELATGGTVEDRIRAKGRCGIEISQALRWTRQACEGLVRTHSAGPLHNDIKPGNIFLDAVGEALLGDFGLAMLMDPQGTTPAAGTFQTMAPEVAAQLTIASARPATVARDVYSVGAALYWMIAGAPPYEPTPGMTPAQAAAAAASWRPVAIRDLAPHVGQALGQRIAVAMSLDPADRYQSVSALSATLGSLPAAPRNWVRTDECGIHWGCWRGTVSRHSPVPVCAIPSGTNRYEINAVKLPAGTRIRRACRMTTQRQLATAIRAAMRECG
jgi:serine/threonine-protein kinase